MYCKLHLDGYHVQSVGNAVATLWEFPAGKVRGVNVHGIRFCRFEGRLQKFLKFTHLMMNLLSSAQSKNECL